MKTSEFCLVYDCISTCSNTIRLERKYNSHFTVNNVQVFKFFPKLKKQKDENFREMKRL